MKSRTRTVIVMLAAASMVFSVLSVVAYAGDLPPLGTFFDDDGNIREANIEAIAADVVRTNGSRRYKVVCLSRWLDRSSHSFLF